MTVSFYCAIFIHIMTDGAVSKLFYFLTSGEYASEEGSKDKGCIKIEFAMYSIYQQLRCINIT